MKVYAITMEMARGLPPRTAVVSAGQLNQVCDAWASLVAAGQLRDNLKIAVRTLDGEATLDIADVARLLAGLR